MEFAGALLGDRAIAWGIDRDNGRDTRRRINRKNNRTVGRSVGWSEHLGVCLVLKLGNPKGFLRGVSLGTTVGRFPGCSAVEWRGKFQGEIEGWSLGTSAGQ